MRKSLLLTGIFSLLMFIAGQALGSPLSRLFVGYDAALLEMTLHAFQLFSFSFLFSGIAVFGSAFFTALGNGAVSALISFLRTLLFQCLAVLLFPVFWGLNGIWLSTAAAEIMAVTVTALLLVRKRNHYHY